MTRHPSLILLSHDHHHGLVAAQRLKRGAPPHPGEPLAASTARLWREELAGHFRQEEEMLFAVAAGIEKLREPVERALREHRRMREMIEEIGGDATEAAREERARELGHLLEGHIRFEERELFPLLERSLTPEMLAQIGAAITAARG